MHGAQVQLREARRGGGAGLRLARSMERPGDRQVHVL